MVSPHVFSPFLKCLVLARIPTARDGESMENGRTARENDANVCVKCSKMIVALFAYSVSGAFYRFSDATLHQSYHYEKIILTS